MNSRSSVRARSSVQSLDHRPPAQPVAIRSERRTRNRDPRTNQPLSTPITCILGHCDHCHYQQQEETLSDIRRSHDPNDMHNGFPVLYNRDGDAFLFRGELGRGHFGTVVEYNSPRTGSSFALKYSHMPNRQLDDIAGAYYIEDNARFCERLVVPHAVLAPSAQQSAALLMPVAQSLTSMAESVHRNIFPGDDPQMRSAMRLWAIRVAVQVTRSLLCMYENGLCYLDAKPDNFVYMCEGEGRFRVLLADIGSLHRCRIDPAMMSYVPPFFHQDDTDDRDVVWTIGTTLLKLLGVQSPHLFNNKLDMVESVRWIGLHHRIMDKLMHWNRADTPRLPATLNLLKRELAYFRQDHERRFGKPEPETENNDTRTRCVIS